MMVNYCRTAIGLKYFIRLVTCMEFLQIFNLTGPQIESNTKKCHKLNWDPNVPILF